jgi:O-antigen ligase
MTLIVLTEKNIKESIILLMKLFSYVLIPFSILLIKYYPDIGMSYNPYTGAPEYIGVTTSKNMLGQLCLICGYFFTWNLIRLKKRNKFITKEIGVYISILFLILITWLIIKSDSATSMTLLIASTIGLIVFNVIKNNKQNVIVYTICVCAFILILQFTLDLNEKLISINQRDQTLSGRTEIWEQILNFNTNPLIGVGYDSFWLGNRLLKFWDKYWWMPNQAHNGYIEMYLNLGFLGIIFFACAFITAIKKTLNYLIIDYQYGIYKFTFYCIFIVYNLTENAFKGVMWFILLLFIIDCKKIKLTNTDTL